MRSRGMMQPMPLAPTDLPVEDVIDDLREALAGRGHAVLQAEPGAAVSYTHLTLPTNACV